jgi:Zn-dependent protease/CBS domain-containing protein
MKWSFRIARIFGIDVKIHFTFFLVLVIGALNGVELSRHWGISPAAGMALGILFMVLLFLCVLLHEFGHSLVAQRFGIPVRQIILLPIGGVAMMSRNPATAMQELLVAIAGPAVNVVIALVLWLAMKMPWAVSDVSNIRSLIPGPGLTAFLYALLRINIILVLFNLIPAFPMDGGRVLRALLAMRMDYVRATQIAATIGQGLAFVFGFIGLFSNPFLLFIAFFVWIGASQEAGAVQARSTMNGIPVTRAMMTDFRTLSPRDNLSQVVGYILAGSQHDFPVVDANGRVAGVLERDAFMRALTEHGQSAPVMDFVRSDIPEVDSYDMLEMALMRLQEAGSKTLPVTHAGQLVGMITMENITEYLMIRSALKAAGRVPQPLG